MFTFVRFPMLPPLSRPSIHSDPIPSNSGPKQEEEEEEPPPLHDCPSEQRVKGGMASSSQKRKKWTEEEERALIDKYAEMASDGSLARMRTREKKFRPIAAHVNAGHHAVDRVAYPFLWSWKDASTKVQNMRHQYLLVKQKLISALPSPSDGSHDAASAIDWADGVSHWPNFLLYKQVFGDAPLPPKPPDPPPAPPPAAAAVPSFPPAIDDGDLGLGLGFDCCGGDDVDEEGFDYDEVAAAAAAETEPPPPPPPLPPPLMPPGSRKRRRKRPERRRAWAALAAQLARLRERETRLEEREEERERDRRERARLEEEAEEEREKEREKGRREAAEAARRWREEEREWEERMEERRREWRKRVEEMLSQHRAEMEQIQARILHDQQSIIGQLLGIYSQWVVGGLSDGGAGLGSHQHPHHQQHHQPYHSQLMQGLHHMNGIVPGENRVGGDGQEDQFIVDG